MKYPWMLIVHGSFVYFFKFVGVLWIDVDRCWLFVGTLNVVGGWCLPMSMQVDMFSKASASWIVVEWCLLEWYMVGTAAGCTAAWLLWYIAIVGNVACVIVMTSWIEHVSWCVMQDYA